MMLKKMDFKVRMRFIYDSDDLSFYLLKFSFCGSYLCLRIIVVWKKIDE